MVGKIKCSWKRWSGYVVGGSGGKAAVEVQGSDCAPRYGSHPGIHLSVSSESMDVEKRFILPGVAQQQPCRPHRRHS
jgi:hypothetical protein